jgi:hypothetical protein
VPKCNLPLDTKIENMEIIGVDYLIDALAIAMPGADLKAAGSERKENPVAVGESRS